MPKNITKSPVEHMLESASALLLPNTFEIITNPESGVLSEIFSKATPFYFIQCTPELGKTVWITLFHARSDQGKSILYFLDPEGLLLERIDSKWFAGCSLEDVEINCALSWFVSSSTKGASQHTAILCGALAKLLLEGKIKRDTLLKHNLKPEDLKRAEEIFPLSRFPKVVYLNLCINAEYGNKNANILTLTQNVSSLLVPYPEAASKLRWSARVNILLDLIPRNQVPTESDLDGASTKATANSPASTLSFFSDAPEPKKPRQDPSLMMLALTFYTDELNITLEEINSLTSENLLPLMHMYNEKNGEFYNLDLLKGELWRILGIEQTRGLASATPY